jgi:hypothetical protein
MRAYEVTVRTDWKNRVSQFQAKMDSNGLAKYIIIAGDVNTDDELAVPASLITFLEPYGRDIAVVDIRDFMVVMSSELSAPELRDAVNLAYDIVCQPKLCGRDEFKQLYRDVVDNWLDVP